MEEKLIDDQTEEEEQQCSLNDPTKVEEELVSMINAEEEERVLGVQLENACPSDSKLQLIGKTCGQGSLFHGIQVTDLRIPKNMCFTNLSTNYLQYCLGLVEFKAAYSLSTACSPAVPCDIAVNLVSSSKDFLLDRNSELHRQTSKSTSEFGAFVIQCTPSIRDGQWIVRTVDKNPSVRNIPKDPFLHPLGALRSIVNIAGVGLIDFKGTKSIASMSFPVKHGFDSPKKPTRETVYDRNQKHGSKSFNKRFLSFSNTKSTGLDQSPTPSSATYLQGRLHCKLQDGSMYFVYSVSGHRETYVAKGSRFDSLKDTELDYMYAFYTRKGGRRGQGGHDNSDVLAGKMKVSSSLSRCTSSNHSKHKETEFVLFSADAEHYKNTAGSTSVSGKTKAYPNKVVDIFKPKQLHMSMPFLKSGRQNSIPEEVNFDPRVVHKLESDGFLVGPPNFELAAIVVKEHILDNHQEMIVGGWGLKFLERARVERANTSKEASYSSENSQESCCNNCSTTVNVIIPAGLHGGPITRSGGPSTLTKRWKSGGHCDCGGWDVGCHLTVLNNHEEVRSNAPLSLVVEGAKKNVPRLKITKTNQDEYQIQFQSSLTALQSFAVGVAIIHTRSQSVTSKTIKS